MASDPFFNVVRRGAWAWTLRALHGFGGRALLATVVLLWPSRVGAVPRYDHVVIVVEENHSYSQIIGAADAPTFNRLADEGVSFTDFYAITHPSQPNYLHLFSGASQGIVDDRNPTNIPLSAPNLGAALLAAGRSFVGYSEDLPEVGSVGVDVGEYRQRHVPWALWVDSSPTPGPNTLPPAVHRPFTDFPSDFTQLPDVAFVIPNLVNDMHSGPIEQADTWVNDHLGAFIDWAPSHNSLLIVTWDEDNFQPSNRIPTIFYGANLQPGQYDEVYTLHNLLRTLQDMHGLSPTGGAARVGPIRGVFAGEILLPSTTLSFQEGADYAGTHDTYVQAATPMTSRATATKIITDLDTAMTEGNQPSQGLIRFDNLKGNQPNQIPHGATVLSARLWLTTGSAGLTDPSRDPVELHPMRLPWDESADWTQLVNGVSLDDLEAAAEAEFAIEPAYRNTTMSFVVTESVQAWADGVPNYGWSVIATTADDWGWHSSESSDAALRPRLEVTFRASMPGDANWDGVVDRRDIAIVTSNFGRSVEATWSRGDFNGDTVVDLLDVLLLQSNITTAAAPSAAAVPEPSCLALLGMGATGLSAYRRRRRRFILLLPPTRVRA